MAKQKVKSDTSCCPLALTPRLRLASDAQTAAIRDCFPKGMAQPALRALVAAGYTKLEQLSEATEQEIITMHGMGPAAVRKLRDGLTAQGLSFRIHANCGFVLRTFSE